MYMFDSSASLICNSNHFPKFQLLHLLYFIVVFTSVVCVCVFSEANMLAGINPNLVHVDGGAEVSIYGDFPGDEIWLLNSTDG